MGRLLAALRAEDESAPAAIPATPANLAPAVLRDSQIRGIRSDCNSEAEVKKSQGFADSQDSQTAPVDQSARLLAAIRAECLPDALLGRDDADPAMLANLSEATLRAYAQALFASSEREAGRQPPGWDHAGHCSGCGPVWLWKGAGPALLACPWCWNRLAHKPTPRPRVRCDECQHYDPTAINPADGLIACVANPKLGMSQRAPWPQSLRICIAHRSKTHDQD